MSWQLDAERELVERARGLDEVAEIWLFGSAGSPEMLDEWSDLDIGLVLTGPLDLAALLPPPARVWALDRQLSGRRATCRTVLGDGRRIDLVVGARGEWDGAAAHCRYRTDRVAAADEPGVLTAASATDPAANEVRFVAALAVVKHARGDLLISTHLTLELARLCLVQAMLLRDRDSGTDAHRFGSGRDALAGDVSAALVQLDRQPETIRRLLAVFDRLHLELEPDYVPDWSGLDQLLRRGRLP